MTTGALLFAINNEKINYMAMAQWSAKNIRRHLGIPVAVVTNSHDTAQATGFDHVMVTNTTSAHHRQFDDYATTMTWHNDSRCWAYQLSPWTRTLVLDVDYVVSSSQLELLLTADQDFLAHRHAYDITGAGDFSAHDTFGSHHMPMWWATVMMFRRSTTAQLIFDSMQMVRDNWLHYRNLYSILGRTYRNDYALSIALGMVNGHVLEHAAIPWHMASLLPGPTLTQLAPDQYRVDFDTDSKPQYCHVQQQDFHAMGKLTLEAVVANPR